MQIVKLVFWVLVCQLPGLMAGSAVGVNMGWYHSMNQSVLTPPDWLFGAMWGVLYVLLGVAGFFIAQKGLNAQNRGNIILFIVQLAFNALWTPVFFVRHELGFALLIVSVMIFLTGWLMKRVWLSVRPAFWLLMPYILWLCFAWYLNAAMIYLN